MSTAYLNIRPVDGDGDTLPPSNAIGASSGKTNLLKQIKDTVMTFTTLLRPFDGYTFVPDTPTLFRISSVSQQWVIDVADETTVIDYRDDIKQESPRWMTSHLEALAQRRFARINVPPKKNVR